MVTQDEIRYIDSVLHTAESGPAGVSADPANLEELQMIENHLRYNANVFNNHSSRSDLKKFAQIPDVDVDFDGEMGRVLDTFRVTELVQRNLRNRGLQGRELKDFETLVEAFKVAIVEDLVLVKKDMMEIRMRRAGYLRYTNRTAYGIVEDRYTDTNWKTGERIGSCSSGCSSLTTPSEDSGVQLVYVSVFLPLPIAVLILCVAKLPILKRRLHPFKQKVPTDVTCYTSTLVSAATMALDKRSSSHITHPCCH